MILITPAAWSSARRSNHKQTNKQYYNISVIWRNVINEQRISWDLKDRSFSILTKIYGDLMLNLIYNRITKNQKVDLIRTVTPRSYDLSMTYLSTPDIATKSWMPFDDQGSPAIFSVNLLDNSSGSSIANMTVEITGSSMTWTLMCGSSKFVIGDSFNPIVDEAKIKYSFYPDQENGIKLEITGLHMTMTNIFVSNSTSPEIICTQPISNAAAKGNLSMEINDNDTLSGFYPSFNTSLGG
eukprot:sb/3469109/